MPARRRAPQGCRLSELQISMSLFRTPNQPESRQQNVKLFLRRPKVRMKRQQEVGIQPKNSVFCCSVLPAFYSSLNLQTKIAEQRKSTEVIADHGQMRWTGNCLSTTKAYVNRFDEGGNFFI
jgi:hypothetical protein